MRNQMFHVFRNSPLGRENLMQAAYFCEKQFGLSLAVRIPSHPRFVMRFATGEIVGTLDSSYVRNPDTARAHVEEILAGFQLTHTYFNPTEVAERDRPVIPADWEFMSCPRVISEQSGRIGLGHIGPRVRGIVKHAPFPVFIPAMVFKPWKSVSIFFGGSEVGAVTVREGIAIARLARLPFTLFTQLGAVTREECERALADADLLGNVGADDATWRFFETGDLEANLFAIPHDSLAIVGAAGHRLMTELIFGSKLEIIQATLPNPVVVVGPNCQPRVRVSA